MLIDSDRRRNPNKIVKIDSSIFSGSYRTFCLFRSKKQQTQPEGTTGQQDAFPTRRYLPEEATNLVWPFPQKTFGDTWLRSFQKWKHQSISKQIKT